jgi:hypothetical protein
MAMIIQRPDKTKAMIRQRSDNTTSRKYKGQIIQMPDNTKAR